MSKFTGSPYEKVFLQGTFIHWNSKNLEMTNMGGLRYETTVSLVSGDYQYKETTETYAVAAAYTYAFNGDLRINGMV